MAGGRQTWDPQGFHPRKLARVVRTSDRETKNFVCRLAYLLAVLCHPPEKVIVQIISARSLSSSPIPLNKKKRLEFALMSVP